LSIADGDSDLAAKYCIKFSKNGLFSSTIHHGFRHLLADFGEFFHMVLVLVPHVVDQSRTVATTP